MTVGDEPVEAADDPEDSDGRADGTVQRAVRFDKDLHDRARTHAEAMHTTFSWVVRRAVRRYLDTIEQHGP